METTSKVFESKAFEVYSDFRKAVKENSPKIEVTDKDGNKAMKQEYYLSDLKRNVYNDKDGKEVPTEDFYLNGRKGESIAFQLSINGVLRNATIFHTDKSRDFVGKDFSLLSEKVTDKGLADLASNLDWTKVQGKIQEQEADGPELE